MARRKRQTLTLGCRASGGERLSRHDDDVSPNWRAMVSRPTSASLKSTHATTTGQRARASLQRAPTTQQHACTHFGSCSDTWLTALERTGCTGSGAGQASSPVPVRQFRRRRDVKSPSTARPPNKSASGSTCAPVSIVPATKPANQRVQHHHRPPGGHASEQCVVLGKAWQVLPGGRERHGVGLVQALCC